MVVKRAEDDVLSGRSGSKIGDDGGLVMKAIHIGEYARDLNDITPTILPIPDPSQTSSISSSSLLQLHRSTSLIRVRVCYTSPTHVDTLYARGLHQNNHVKLVHPPFTLGTEFSGYVDKIYPPASSVQDGRVKGDPPADPPRSIAGVDFKCGDRVWGTVLGAFAPYILCLASGLHHVPERISLFDIAGLGASTAPVSYGALIRLAQLQPGETCLVHAAAGGLGVAAVMIAKAIGANVIGTVGSESKEKVVHDLLRRSSGPNSIHTERESTSVNKGDGVVRYDRDGWEKDVLALTGGKGVDVVFDTVGLVGKSIRCCQFGGRIVIVGFVGRGEGKNGVMEQIAMNKILLKGVKVLGYRFGESARRSPEEGVQLWRGFNELINTATMTPVVYKHYRGVESIPGALKELASREVYGKIVIEMTEKDGNPTDRLEDGAQLASHKL